MSAWGIGTPKTKYGRHWLKVIETLNSNDADVRDRAYFAIAEETRLNLHRYKRQPVPQRVGIPDDDEIILNALLGKKPPKGTPKDRMLKMFGVWRYRVWLDESDNLARLMTCISAVHTYRRLDLMRLSKEIEVFVEDEYGLVKIPSDWADAQKAARRATEDLSVMGAELRTMERKAEVFDDGGDPQDDDSVWASQTLPHIPDP